MLMTDTMLAGKYALFAEMMNEARIYLDTGIDFGSACRYLGLDEETFDAVLTDELGLGGNEIFRRRKWQKTCIDCSNAYCYSKPFLLDL